MNTIEMWLKAQKDGKIYYCRDVAYSKKFGFVDKDNFDDPWELAAWDYLGNRNLDGLMADCEWEEMPTMTIKEVEDIFGIKIVDDMMFGGNNNV